MKDEGEDAAWIEAAPPEPESAPAPPVVAAAALVPGARSYSVPGGAMGTKTQRVLLVLGYWLFGTFFVHVQLAALALFLPVGAFLFFSFGGVQIRVGDDGLLVAQVFFPFARIEYVTQERDEKGRAKSANPTRPRDANHGRPNELFVRDEGTHLFLALPSGRSFRMSYDDPTVCELAKDMRARWERYRTSAGTEVPAALTAAGRELASADARGARSILMTLRERFAAPSYRDEVVTPEQLWRVAEDPHTQPRVRVVAVAALSAGATDEERTRLRELAAANADEPTRVQMELASDPAMADDLASAIEDEPEQRRTAALRI